MQLLALADKFENIGQYATRLELFVVHRAMLERLLVPRELLVDLFLNDVIDLLVHDNKIFLLRVTHQRRECCFDVDVLRIVVFQQSRV